LQNLYFFLQNQGIIRHGKKRPQIAGGTGFSIDRTGCSPAVSSACPVSKLTGTAVSFRRSGTAHLEGHIFGLRVLNQDRDRRFDHCLEAHQRARECREAILREGMTVVGRDGQAKVHPLLAVERDARQAFLSAVRTLGLEL